MKTIHYLFAFSILLSSCASHKKIVQGSAQAATVTADGSSFDKAIYITEDRETPGIRAEYDWINKKYPGYKTRSQSLNYYQKKPYDIINITTADGTELAVYFDISNYFGKF